jgi:hypothetical protein
MKAKRDVDAVLADLEQARRAFLAAERRARTYLVRNGVLDQTSRGLITLLRDSARASSKT